MPKDNGRRAQGFRRRRRRRRQLRRYTRKQRTWQVWRHRVPIEGHPGGRLGRETCGCLRCGVANHGRDVLVERALARSVF